jgi:hypothetical protein
VYEKIQNEKQEDVMMIGMNWRKQEPLNTVATLRYLGVVSISIFVYGNPQTQR